MKLGRVRLRVREIGLVDLKKGQSMSKSNKEDVEMVDLKTVKLIKFKIIFSAD